MAFLKTQILVTSIFVRRYFSSILLLLSSKLRVFAKQYNVLVCCFPTFELASFDFLHSNELISFDYFLNVLFSFHTMSIFSSHIEVIPLKLNQDKNLKLLTREF